VRSYTKTKDWFHRDNLINTSYNSDGLINCLRQPELLQSEPLKSMREDFLPFIEFTAPRLFRLPGQSLRRAAGHRAGAVFFARYLDYFIVTRNSQPLPGLATVTQLHRDPKLTAIYRDWQKTRHRDADGT
jgi:hypothetical protein